MKPQGPKTAEDGATRTRHVVIGTAGHIDHGKTSLVYALTGTDTDRLPEEKQRGITIDLGFASLELQSPAGEGLHLSLIDVPGHYAFISNMLAGTGGIDCVMLVIAADEGVKAQTTEHLAICGLLGVERGVVALTKCDAVSSEHLERTREDVRRFLENTFLEGAPVLAVSALRGDGLPMLKQALAELAMAVPLRGDDALMRLPLDRSFSMRGFGTVVTGTLHSGAVRVGDAVEQQPGGRELRIRSLQVHGIPQPMAQAPCRVALNVPGIEVEQIGRGDTLIAPSTVTPARTFDVALSMLPGASALRHGSRVRVHGFTAESVARILLFDQKDTHQPGSGFARLKLAQPMLLLPGDRIVLRQCSPAVTIGGARVLDATPVVGQRKTVALGWLQKLAAADVSQHVGLLVERRGADGITLERLRAETGLTVETLRTRVAPLLLNGALVEFRSHNGYVNCADRATAITRAEEEMARAGSLSLAELRSRTKLNAPVFELVLEQMVASGSFELAGDRLRKPGEDISAAKRKLMQAVEDLYVRAGLAAPLLADVARQLTIPPLGLRDLITLLLRARRLVRMGADDAFVHPTALEKLYGQLRAHRGESFDVGRFKSFTGLTRKHAIPLLEHLDQARVTRNSGGTRVVL